MSTDDDLRARAQRVLPGGMYGHMNVGRRMPPGYPQFFARSAGARLWDVDGNEFLDYMCGFGPMIAGYGNPIIRAAADAQRSMIDTATGPAPVAVELAERFVNQVGHARWALFGKNGNDATTGCVMIARAHTGRRIVLVADGAYHGSQPWANRNSPGVVGDDHAYFVRYTYNDVEDLRAKVAAHADDLAAIVVSAFQHDAFKDQALPTPAFQFAARSLCDDHNAALILDEVRAGLRLSLDSTWDAAGVPPDLSAWSKAIANGEPLAAILGNEIFRDAAASVFMTGSFWCQPAPMAAAIATLDHLSELDAPQQMARLGEALRSGLNERAQRAGLGLRQTGPAQMPMILFEDDPKLEKGFAFCTAMVQQGIYMHPWHNMFLSTAHTETDIAQTLDAASVALRSVPAA